MKVNFTDNDLRKLIFKADKLCISEIFKSFDYFLSDFSDELKDFATKRSTAAMLEDKLLLDIFMKINDLDPAELDPTELDQKDLAKLARIYEHYFRAAEVIKANIERLESECKKKVE